MRPGFGDRGYERKIERTLRYPEERAIFSDTGTAERSRLPTNTAAKERAKQLREIAIPQVRVVFRKVKHKKKISANRVVILFFLGGGEPRQNRAFSHATVTK